ncbi:hypothetical protein BDZ89DRAFT_1137674 [Hymenopellis radicata]|nr:hypothetical protein BDZ89DRAFT_1137674 [Hymenopellis radicata]
MQSAAAVKARVPRNPVFDVLSSHIRRLQTDSDSGQLSDHHEILGILRRLTTSEAGDRGPVDAWLVQRALDWSGNIIQPLKHFLTVVEDTVSAHPVLAGFVWGCIRFVLTGMSGHSKHFESATKILKDICSRLSFYRDVDPAVYRNSPAVQDALARLLGAILDLCYEVYHIYHNRVNGPIPLLAISLPSKDPWKSANMRRILARFNEAEAELRRVIKNERKSRAMSDSSSHARLRAEEDRRYIIENQQTGDYQHKVHEYRRMLMQIPHARIVDRRAKILQPDLGTEDWILRTPEYSSWSSVPLSMAQIRSADHILHIHGKMNDNPTYVVLDDLLHQHKRYRETLDISVSFYRCQTHDPDYLDPLIVLGSIFGDLLSHLPIHLQHQYTSLQFDTVSQLEESIRLVAQNFDKAYIVLEDVTACPPLSLDRIVLSVKKMASTRTVYVAIVDRTTERLSRAFRTSPTIALGDEGQRSAAARPSRKLSPAGSAYFEDQASLASASLRAQD